MSDAAELMADADCESDTSPGGRRGPVRAQVPASMTQSPQQRGPRPKLLSPRLGPPPLL